MFQFTRPAWGATTQSNGLVYNSAVSIHAPRVGRDELRVELAGYNKFQFTRPAWGATQTRTSGWNGKWFQFTRPACGATMP